MSLQATKVQQEALIRGTPKIDFTKDIDYSVLANRVAIVTGGASGIGLGIAKALAKHGAWVPIIDVKREDGERALSELRSTGSQEKTTIYLTANVADYNEQMSAFQHVLQWSAGQLDVVVASAGIRATNISQLVHAANQDPTSPLFAPPEIPADVLHVNLNGTYYSVYLALVAFHRQDMMKSRDEKHWKPQLVLVSSLAGFTDHALSADYAASKYGVRGLWKSIRNHGAEHFGGCQSNLLAPTYINNRGDSKSRGNAAGRANWKLGEVEDVVQGALRCICDFNVDGRAVACVRGSPGTPGSNNFDMCDDLGDYSGGKALLEQMRAGAFGELA